jgi:flagellar assembly protein FliH/type III secretion protein L
MTLERARIIKGAAAQTRPEAAAAAAERARIVPRAVLEARAEAERILAEARTSATAIAADAARDARDAEIARLAASFLALRREDERRAERDLDRAVELAVLLAERLVGEAIAHEPARIAHLAASALAEARGARRVKIDACPDDTAALATLLRELGFDAEIGADASLARGSLVVHTDLGRIDGRLEPQLRRLAVALREALK